MSVDAGFDAGFDTPAQDETTALLIRARGFLERGWCRGTVAEDGDGETIDPFDERAVRWCATGAVQAAAGQIIGDDHPAFQRLAMAMDVGLYAADFDGTVSTFNDAQETIEPVLEAFDRAIAAGKA